MSDKYYRLVTFVVDICPKPLRELFISKAKADQGTNFTTLDSFLLSRKTNVDNLLHGHIISNDQHALIYPSNGPVNVQAWDVTLLAVLLKNLFGQLQQTEIQCMRAIQDERNKLQHIANSGHINDNDFNTSWSVLDHAVTTLSQHLSSPLQHTIIAKEINEALTESMPNLGYVLRIWHRDMFVQLQLQNATLEDKLDLQAAQIDSLKEESKKSNTILTNATVKRKGRYGVPEKRIKVLDKSVERMRETLGRGLREENDSLTTNKKDVGDITEQLKNNHRVIVTGFDKQKPYKCALAAVKEMKYERIDQCLQIDNPSDWKRVGFEDVRVVLFQEPFGRSIYNVHKVEVMLEEFGNMLEEADENNDNVIDIIIVTNQKLLKEVTRQHEHDMLSPASIVYIDSTADTETGDLCTTDDSVHGNLLESSKMYRRRYKIKRVDNQIKEEAERLFMENSTVAIVGSTGSGTTSLSFQLLPSYDLSDGENNFLVLMDPDDLKYVKLSLKPVLILKLLTGIAFDSVEAHKWFRQFDVLYAAVQEKKAAIISVMDSECFQMWQSNMPTHPLLEHVVFTDGGSKIKTGKPVNVTAGISSSSTQTDQTSNSDDNDKNVTDQRVRSVKSVRTYSIKTEDNEYRCNIHGCYVLPTGEVLLTDFMNKKLKKLNVDNEHVSECSLPSEPYNVCYIGNNEAVVSPWSNKLQFVNVAGSMTLTREIDTDHHCRSLACHGNLLYVTDEDSVHVYTTDGTYQKCLYTGPGTDYYDYSSITVSNDGSRIYIIDDDNGSLITINNSGQHEFTLFDVTHQSYRGGVCVDDQGYVFVIEYDEDDDTSVIVQISSDGRQKLGTVFELDNGYNTITFDREKSALMVADSSNQISVLKFQ